jgi:hypothetical protein
LGGVSTLPVVAETAKAAWGSIPFKTQPCHFNKEEMDRSVPETPEAVKLPICIRATDGKNVGVKCPPNSSASFYNHKGYFP